MPLLQGFPLIICIYSEIEVPGSTACGRTTLWCNTTIVGCVLNDVSIIDRNALTAIDIARNELDSVGFAQRIGSRTFGDEHVANGVVCSVGITIVVSMLVKYDVGMNKFIIIGIFSIFCVECIYTKSPCIESPIDEVTTFFLTGCYMNRVTGIKVDITARTALNIIGVVACFIGKTVPSGAIGTVVVL